MPRTKKQAEPQLVEQLVSVGDSIEHTVKSRGAVHKRAAEVTYALIDSQKDLNGKQLSLWLEEQDIEIEDVTILRKGFNLRPGALQLLGFFQKKIGKEHSIDRNGKAITLIGLEKKVRIGGYEYDSPWIRFTAYEAIKQKIGDRRPSTKDYADFQKNFKELEDQWHIFSMQIDGKKKELRSRIITDVVIEDDQEGGKRYSVALHPMTTAQLGNWFRFYPDDFENQIAIRGGNRSPYIYDLANLVIYERDMPNTRRDGYFERERKTLIAHLKLEDYEQRRKQELNDKLDFAFKALEGWLIDKVEILTDRNGGIKYRIYPSYDAVKEIENGAA